ncbi:MAG TPA: Uma2 family endonuclease [Verrucomicrobiales bacterium]|nr:Uma2 family endonuclease [Verrucomicrobiales bacterium]
MSKAASPLTEPSPFRFSVEDYYLLAQAGAFGGTTHTELIEGEIIEMPPAGPEHSGNLDSATSLIYRCLPSGYQIRCQGSLRVSENTELEPDITILRYRPDKYTKSHPTPDDALLVIEISKSSLSYDLKRKAAVFAKAGLKEYWVVDLDGRQLHVLTQPAGETYGQHQILSPGGEVRCSTIPELVLPVESLFV